MTLSPPQKPAPESRRLRIVNISNRAILLMFSRLSFECLLLEQHPQLPDGYVIRGVSYAPERDCFAFLIEHPSYEEVPEYQMIPWEDGDCLVKSVVAIREADGRYRIEQ
jgi:hypothetical protein